MNCDEDDDVGEDEVEDASASTVLARAQA